MLALLLVSVLSCYLIEFTVVADKPNIVVVIADDMGWNDVGFHGSEVPTPNLDALAYNGIILNRHYTLPTCTPSRAAFLTGKYPSRIGMQGGPIPVGNPLGISLKEQLMPQYFKKIGYDTHLVGKWHVGYFSPPYLPTNRGFDSFFGFYNGYLDYYDGTHYENNKSGLDAWRNTSKAWHEFYGKYLTTLVTEEAVSVIDKHAADGKKDGLFMVVASPAPHRGNRNIRLEPPPYSYGHRLSNVTDENRRIYADIVKALDDTIGDVSVALKKNGMFDNSIIAFFSDNGAPTTDDVWHYENYGSNWPLKGEKVSVHEGGVRTSAAVWGSSFTNTSRIHSGLFHISDWLPTLYSAAGGNVTDLKDLDGIDQWKTLKNGGDDNLRKEILVDMQDVAKIEALIKDNWKLVKNYVPNLAKSFSDKYYGTNFRDTIEYNKTEIYTSKFAFSLGKNSLTDRIVEGLREESTIKQICDDKQREASAKYDCHSKYCLYNIEVDPCECNDLAMANPNIVQELIARLNDHRKQLVKGEKHYFDEKSLPGESNYWEPWVNASSCLFISKLILLIITILRYYL